jgi:uncharacterized protein YjbI with pentapeptide repeats
MLLLENKPNLCIPNYKENKYKIIENTLLRYTNLCQDIINCIIIPYATNEDLIGINLSHGKFCRFDLIKYQKNIILNSLDIRHSNLSYCNLSYIFLNNIDLSDSNLTHIKIHYIRHSTIGGLFIQRPRHNDNKFNRCNLECASFDGIQIYNGQIMNSNLIGSQIRNCTFNNVDFNGSDLRGCKLYNSEFLNCTFDNCDMREIDFRNINIVDCTFHNTNLEYSNLCYQYMGLLCNAMLTGAKTNSSILYKCYPQMSYVGRIN